MKKIINNIIDIGYKALIIFSIIVFAIALIWGTFGCVNRSYNYLNPLILILGIFLAFFGTLKIYNLVKKLNTKQRKILVIILLIIQFIFLLISAFTISSLPKVDLIHILTEINSLNQTGSILNDTYFSVYPINRFLLMILYNVQKISPNYMYQIFYILSSVCISITTIFTYKTVNKALDNDKAITALILTVLSPIYYLYVSYYYTDILMLPFASMLIYFIVKQKDEKNIKSHILSGVLIGLVAAIGYKIRAISIFILIAYVIYLVISKSFKETTLKIVPIIFSFLAILLVIKPIENKMFKDADSNKEFPLTHWIMMGVNEKSNGYYTQDDYELSFSAANVEERTQLNIKEIKNRLSNFSLFTGTKFFAHKLYVVWGKGDYSYQKYLDTVNSYNISYRYLLEDKNIILNYVLQISKLTTLIFVIITYVYLFKSKGKSIMVIALFGAIIFYLMWEVCPRYGLSFLPWLTLISVTYFDKIIISPNKYLKISRKLVLMLSIVLLIIGYITWTRPTLKDYTVSKNGSKKIVNETLNNNEYMLQSMKLKMRFNALDLVVIANNNSMLKVELLDSAQNILESKIVEVSPNNNENFTRITFSKHYNKGTYYIKISLTTEGNVEISTAYKEMFDTYPEGSLVVNGEKMNSDLIFNIVDYGYYAVYNKFEYIMISISLLTSIVIIFNGKKEKNEKK